MQAHPRPLQPAYALVLVSLVGLSGWVAERRPVETFEVVSRSMVPTLVVGDRVLTVSCDWSAAPLAVGELVVFRPPSWIRSEIPVVKRIVAQGGDRVDIHGGALYVNGARRDEPYARRYPADYRFGPQVVPPGTLFVLGDNRPLSEDSTTFGPISIGQIQSVVLARLGNEPCALGARFNGLPEC